MVFARRNMMGHHATSFIRNSKWVTNALKIPPTHYNLHNLMDLIEWLFQNCFIQLGNQCYRQIHGIPMGFSCSPVMCNLYLAYFEYSWTLKQLEISTNSIDLTLFQHTYRYMDDVLSLNNPIFSSCLPQIYPDNLMIEPTYMDCMLIGNDRFVTKTTFLNFELSLLTPFTGNYVTNFSWKQDILNLGQIEYVKRKSNRPHKVAIKTCLGMVYLIMYSSSDSFLAFQSICHLQKKFIYNGFVLKELRSTI